MDTIYYITSRWSRGMALPSSSQSDPARERNGCGVVLLLLASLAFTGCQSGAETTPSFAVTDSAGVEIVTSLRAAWSTSEAWSLEPTPSFRVGVAGGDPIYELWEVVGVELLSDGTVAIVNAGSSELRLFDRRGRAVQRMGRQGAGPGEFTRIMGVAVAAGDTLLALDWDGSLVAFDRLGNLIREEPRTEVVPRAVFLTHPVPDASIIGMRRYRQEMPQGPYRAPMDLVRVKGDSVIAEYGTLLNLEQEFLPDQGGRVRIAPFAAWSTYAANSDASRIVIGDNVRFNLHQYDGAGRLHRLIRWVVPPRRPTQSDLERWTEGRKEFARSEDEIRLIEQDLAAVEIPETMPAFSHLILDATGALWVGEFSSSDAGPTLFQVFGEQGVWMGEVEVPEGLLMRGVESVEIAEDMFFGVWKDELGVEQVRGYPIRKP